MKEIAHTQFNGNLNYFFSLTVFLYSLSLFFFFFINSSAPFADYTVLFHLFFSILFFLFFVISWTISSHYPYLFSLFNTLILFFFLTYLISIIYSTGKISSPFLFTLQPLFLITTILISSMKTSHPIKIPTKIIPLIFITIIILFYFNTIFHLPTHDHNILPHRSNTLTFINYIFILIINTFFITFSETKIEKNSFLSNSCLLFDYKNYQKYILIIIMAVLFFTLSFAFMREWPLFFCNFSYIMTLFFFLLISKKIKSHDLSLNLLLFASHLLLTAQLFFTGGIFSKSIYYYFLIPLAAFFLQGKKYGFIWSILVFETALFFYLMDFFNIIHFQYALFQNQPIISLSYILGIILINFLFIYIKDKEEQLFNQQAGLS